ncbi:MAG: prepilin-type N-terminal cleavage/methylation domain-containing protein [Nitrospirota bacterium]
MRKGLSLIEVLIAVSLFAIVAMISSSILIDIVQLEKKSSVQNAIYEDLRIMLQLLTKEIQSGTIDYDEYYNYCVIQGADAGAFFGVNHGVYGSRFFDPGKSLDPDPFYVVENPKDLGLECSYMSGGECEVVYTLSTDLNTGQNPFYGVAADANAFEDRGVGGCKNGGVTDGITDHLFLIDNTGTQKTLIAKKLINILPDVDYAIGLVRMRGIDIDQNGLVDTFTCLDEFDCDANVAGALTLPYLDLVGKSPLEIVNDLINPITLPQELDLNSLFDANATQFVPISPLRADIQELKFIIQPLEDPYKAFAEPDSRAHPTVTIILTVGLSENAELDYPGEFEPITVQTTVAAGVLGRIETYPPVNEIMSGAGTGWIDNVIPGLSTP